jgi:DNA repair protein SbcC/Rad50
MNLKLLNLKLTNFKGIQSLEIAFDGETKTIAGANATGKTTVFDAWSWLLFGKDSHDRASFEIKTLGRDNKPIHHMDHEVEALVSDGDQRVIKIKRTYKEKWVKKRGSEETSFEGHETLYTWNDVPVSASEFDEKRDGLIKESTFKLISNPNYFNQQLAWKERREMLIGMAGDIKDADVVAVDGTLADLISVMEREQKTIEDLSKEYAAKKKLLKKQLDDIPGRIDELNRVEVSKPDIKLAEAEQAMAELTAQVTNHAQAHDTEKKKLAAAKARIRELEVEIMEREKAIRKSVELETAEHRNKIVAARKAFQQAQDDKDTCTTAINKLHVTIEKAEADMERLRKQWNTINNEAFHMPDGMDKCPTCGQGLPNAQEKARELSENWTTDKINRLKAITEQGKEIKKVKEEMEAEIERQTTILQMCKTQQQEANKEIGVLLEVEAAQPKADDLIEKDADIIRLNKEITKIEDQFFNTPSPDLTIKEIEQQRDELFAMVQQYKSAESQELSLKKRKKELLASEKTLAAELADMERFEFAIERFTKVKMEMVERRVNDLFDYVTFKMFNDQINGGQKPTCETLINGVPYSDANNGARIRAGVDVCNAFSRHLDVCAPIWIDNREAVTGEIFTTGQLIALVVDENAYTLIIS